MKKRPLAIPCHASATQFATQDRFCFQMIFNQQGLCQVARGRKDWHFGRDDATLMSHP